MDGRAERLRLRAEELVEEDSLAYLAYRQAVPFRQDVQDARQEPWHPLEIARAAAEVAALAEESASSGNPRLRADAWWL